MFFQVASRQVFVCTGIIYLLFGILGKFSAVFVTIPHPVLGGASVAMFSALFGVVTSNLQVNYNYITKTCLYNVDPLKTYFYIVKLGFTGA